MRLRASVRIRHRKVSTKHTEVNRPPIRLAYRLHTERLEALARNLHELLRGDRRTVQAAILPNEVRILVDLEVQPDLITLARDYHARAVRGVYRGAVPDVREVRIRGNVEHAPDVLGRLAIERDAEGLAHPGARAVGPKHELGMHGLALDFVEVLGVEVGEFDGDGVGLGIVQLCLVARDFDGEWDDGALDLDTVGAHGVNENVLNGSLVQGCFKGITWRGECGDIWCTVDTLTRC